MVLLLAITAAQAAELRCSFVLRPFGRYHYECMGQVEESPSDNTITVVTGDHKPGLGGNDVSSVTIFKKSSMTVLPNNLKLWFQNFLQFKLNDLPNFPGFKAEDFNEFSHLKSFMAIKLPLVRTIPKDAFKTLTKLEVLGLNEMTNLENLDGDLLAYATSLEIFSVRGPNKINQISPGFFRSQAGSLQSVDYTDTKLLKINFSVFNNLKILTDAFFGNAGCLDVTFNFGNVKDDLIQEIRKNCQNFNAQSDNRIVKKMSWSSFSSSSE